MIKDICTLLGMLYGISPGRVVFTALIGSATAILSVLQIKSIPNISKTQKPIACVRC